MAVIPHELLDRFLDETASLRRLSPNTVEAYGNDLAQWNEFLSQDGLDWKNVTQTEVYDFLSFEWKEKNTTRSTQARKLAALKQFYRFATREGEMEKNPLESIFSPKVKKPLPHPLRPGEMETLLEGDTGQSAFLQARDKALCELMYSTGLRVSELLSLKCDDIMTAGSVATELKVTGKGKKDRFVFIGEAAKTAIEEYLQLRASYKHTALFLNGRGGPLTRRGVNYILKKRSALLDLSSEHSAHSLRHSFATDMLNMGADIRTVQEMLGHASISTTQNYTRVAKDRIRDTFRRCHPHSRKG